MAKAKNLALSLSTAIITFSAGCSSNSTNGSVQNLVEQQEEVVASKSNLPLAKSIQVDNPGNKFTKVVFIHLTAQKKVSTGFRTEALGEEANSYELTIENLDTGDTTTGTFLKGDKVILGSLIIGGNYKLTAKALLNNEVIAIAERVISITDTTNDIYLNYVAVPNPTPIQTKEATVTIDGGIIDTRVPVETPKPTLSVAPVTSTMTSTTTPSIGYASGTAFEVKASGLKMNTNYKVYYANDPSFTNASTNMWPSDANGNITFNFASSNYIISKYYYKFEDLTTKESTTSYMEIVPGTQTKNGTLTANKVSYINGENVVIKGTGYDPYTTLRFYIYYKGGSGNVAPEEIITDASGNFTKTISSSTLQTNQLYEIFTYVKATWGQSNYVNFTIK